jgi:adenine-specific DNA-methyltransferase
MSAWAITNRSARIFDPSFGAGVFLRAAASILSKLGAPKPGEQIYGVDIDPGSQRYLEPLAHIGARPDQFRITDFLSTRAEDLNGSPYDAIVGNPPYVRYRFLSQTSQDEAQDLSGSRGWKLSTKGSSWAYFLMHAIDLIALGGRLAVVLPGALLHSDYAAPVRTKLRQSFASVYIGILQDRLFPDAQESSLIVLAEGRGRRRHETRIGVLGSLGELMTLCSDPRRYTIEVREDAAFARWKVSLVSPHARDLLGELRTKDQAVPLGSLVDIRIGVVTGCNRTFVVDRRTRRDLNLNRRFWRPIIARAANLRGLAFGQQDYRDLRDADVPSSLLTVPQGALIPHKLRSYLNAARDEGISRRYKCRIRKVWYRVEDHIVPDAFLQYMAARSPRLSLNDSSATCTNNIHRIFWKSDISRNLQRWLAIACMSSVFQLGAEIGGRSYGGEF